MNKKGIEHSNETPCSRSLLRMMMSSLNEWVEESKRKPHFWPAILSRTERNSLSKAVHNSWPAQNSLHSLTTQETHFPGKHHPSGLWRR